MAVVIASGSVIAVAANTKTADQVSGQFQHVGRGRFILAVRSSATGMNVECRIGGVTIAADTAIPFTGTIGAISVSDHTMVAQTLEGGRVELFLRNTTGGSLNTDFLLLFEPL